MKTNFTKEELTHISHHFWYRLKFLIYQSPLHISTFLEKAEMSVREYQRIKRGNNPTLYTICKMAKVLEVHPMELLNFDLNKIVNRKIEFTMGKKPNKNHITHEDYMKHPIKKEKFDFKVIKKSKPK